MTPTIPDILSICGYPTDVVVLDVETYFDRDYSLKKMSNWEYVTDERFEELGWAVKWNDRPAEFQTDFPETIDWDAVTVIMHSAPFDALILAQRHDIHPPFIVDTLDLARHVEPRWRNGLKDLCERHGLKAKGDTMQFQELHGDDLADKQRTALIDYACNDADRTYDLLNLLLPKLSNPAFELRIAAYTRNLALYPTLNLDMGRADTLKKAMLVEIDKALIRAQITGITARSDKGFGREMREALGDESPPMKHMKKGPMLAIAKTDAGYSYLLNHPLPRVRELMLARDAAKSWPGQITRVSKLQAMVRAAGGKVPIPLKYCGAHSARWSGDQSINPQNFTARGHPLANEVRTLIEAPDGHVLITEDLSQIEARDLDWFADQLDMVQAWAEGRQIYCEFASRLTGQRIRKPTSTDDPEVAAWYGKYRQMGKVGVLGAGFGMGPDRCMDYARDTYGIDLDYAMAKRIIDSYRQTHEMVVRLWGQVEQAFRRATQGRGRVFEIQHGLKFYREGNTTIIELPSTRRLTYTGARVEGTTRRPQLVMPDPKSPQVGIHMWGGYLVENIIQSTSRDILAEAILRIEDELSLRVAMTVHDDISVIVPEDKAEYYRPKIEAIMRTAPAWAPGLPIDVEGKISKRYCK